MVTAGAAPQLTPGDLTLPWVLIREADTGTTLLQPPGVEQLLTVQLRARPGLEAELSSAWADRVLARWLAVAKRK